MVHYGKPFHLEVLQDTDGDTYITVEETNDDDYLRFYTDGTENMN